MFTEYDLSEPAGIPALGLGRCTGISPGQGITRRLLALLELVDQFSLRFRQAPY